MARTRVERDSLGTIEVLANRLRGAQTQIAFVTEREWSPTNGCKPEEMLRSGVKRLAQGWVAPRQDITD
jgi:fumarate hydratase class II